MISSWSRRASVRWRRPSGSAASSRRACARRRTFGFVNLLRKPLYYFFLLLLLADLHLNGVQLDSSFIESIYELSYLSMEENLVVARVSQELATGGEAAHCAVLDYYHDELCDFVKEGDPSVEQGEAILAVIEVVLLQGHVHGDHSDDRDEEAGE